MQSVRRVTAMVALGVVFLSAVAHGIDTMDSAYLYEEKDYQIRTVSMPPQVFKISGGLFGSYRNVSLFPVPFDNAVGSNDMGNAITIISFPKGKIDYDRYFRNAADDMSGGGTFVSQTAKDSLGYGQVRRFLLFDFKKKLHREYRIVFPITQSIQKIALVDPERRHFLFEIRSQKRNTKNPFDADNFLQLIDLSDEKDKTLRELNIGTSVWSTSHDRVFVFRAKTKELQVFNMNLEPAHYPLEEAFNHNKNYIDSIVIQVHPYLPFAIFSGGRNGSIYLSWGKDKEASPLSLFSAATLFSFSPDGKWLVFKRADFANDTTKTYLMPVSEKYPHYLGSPILLADKYFNEGKLAWTSNPTGFVGSSLDKIYHWDLENQDFPEKGKTSFHDYIVKKDLEKLTREKRQGLGNKH